MQDVRLFSDKIEFMNKRYTVLVLMKRSLSVILCTVLFVFCACVYVSAEEQSDPPVVETFSLQGSAREIDYDERTWSRVTVLHPSQEYLITVREPGQTDEENSLYYAVGSDIGKSWTVTSGTRGISLVQVNDARYSLTASDDGLSLRMRDLKPPSEAAKTTHTSASSRGHWRYSGSKLSCKIDDTVYYLTFENGQISCSQEEASAADIVLFTDGPNYNPCITGQPQVFDYVIGEAHEAPLPKVQYDDTLEELSMLWMIDGVPFESAEAVQRSLKERSYGIYRVTCSISGWKDSIRYGETSPESSFIVASGVLENSFLTFSDVHMEFSSIADAVQEIMNANDGKIPSLVICTGDWGNGSTASYETTKNSLLPTIKAELGGLDTVYVAGNHENGLAAAEETLAADLGADESVLRCYGELFNSNAARNNSALARSLSVYGISYDALGKECSYDAVTEDITEYLAEIAENDPHTLVVISAHAGLHQLNDWAGGSHYNIAGSDRLCRAINEAVDQYGLDVLFLFGHDHSRNETEFFLNRNETISAVKIPEEEAVETKLHFSYGHAGYLTSEIGTGTRHYSLFSWNEETITRSFAQIGSNTPTATQIMRLAKTEPASPETPAFWLEKLLQYFGIRMHTETLPGQS